MTTNLSKDSDLPELDKALNDIESCVKHFTRIPSKFEDSDKRCDAHAAVALLRKAIAAQTAIDDYIRGRNDGFIEAADKYQAAPPTQAIAGEAWQEISTLPFADDLVWLMKGDSVDGPRSMDTDDYDIYTHWAPCEPPSIAAPSQGAKQ